MLAKRNGRDGQRYFIWYMTDYIRQIHKCLHKFR
jgi:hypothetical protein